MLTLSNGDLIKKAYVSINGKARKIKDILVGVSGIARHIYREPLLYSVLSGSVKTVAGEMLESTVTSYSADAPTGGVKSASFSGSEYIAYKMPLEFTTATKFTISGWFKFTTVTDYRSVFIIGGEDLVDNGNFTMRLYRKSTGAVMLACFVGEGSGGGFYTRETAGGALTANTWLHIALEVNMPSDSVQLYVNGVKWSFKSAVTPKTYIGAINLTNATHIYIGTPSSLSSSGSYAQRKPMNFIGSAYNLVVYDDLYYNDWKFTPHI